VGDADGGLPFRLSKWTDRAVLYGRGHRLPRLYHRALTAWAGLRRGLDFSVQTKPIGAGYFCANHLLLCRAQ
jgi:hypothetical protein